MTLLSAAMIVRNEQSFLPDCLQSIQNIAEEIVVVDTGSTDRTLSIARQFNARISVFPWQNDFSAPRNEALRLCRGKWILYIDADERIDKTDADQIKPYLEDNKKVAYTVRFYPTSGFSAYREYRIFKNDPRIRYAGVIHETMLPAIQDVARSDGLKIGKIPLTIRHLGYDADQTAKHRRNLPLLKRAVEKDPQRSYLWWHMGTALMALGDKQKAVRAWQNGLEKIRQKDDCKDHDSLIYGELIRFYHHQGKKVMPLIDEALERFPNQYFIIWLKAVVLKNKQQYKAAALLFEELTAVDSGSLDDIVAYDDALFKALSLEPLGDCYFKLAHFEQSVQCYRKCELLDPDNISFKIKRQFVETRL